MAIFSNVFLAVISKNEDDAGTSNLLNLTINIDGDDVLDKDFEADLDDGEAEALSEPTSLPIPFDSTALTNSSRSGWAFETTMPGGRRTSCCSGRHSPRGSPAGPLRWQWKPICRIGSAPITPRGTSQCPSGS